eukprot:CAMPEP_0182920620 /NCGR_PEP_ID=MMETSP0105_2-20130417/3602_1 /TAXON_ID=81532 ORGANISM="Acanthoeca-like sp., Strain 10tr" /NCGR_SAMPLE_ID=MMETSP0105_2 /ASSEMBLY_ACC=CAM_ASM_000205 /LENGTH=169 /DNA_ID=CAMNT_0025058047 /DNA_START=33 /DNA_END=542 /DNA_ORIENTATION=-
MPGKIDRSQPDKIFIEGFDAKEQKEPIIIEDGVTLKHGIFVGKCTGQGLAIVVKGKIKNLTVSGCDSIGVVVDQVVTTVEVINCKKVSVQATEQAGSWVVDKSDRTTIYAPEKSIKDKLVLVSCMSTSTNVMHPDEKGEDTVENPVPDQIQSVFRLGAKAEHTVIIPES